MKNFSKISIPRLVCVVFVFIFAFSLTHNALAQSNNSESCPNLSGGCSKIKFKEIFRNIIPNPSTTKHNPCFDTVEYKTWHEKNINGSLVLGVDGAPLEKSPCSTSTKKLNNVPKYSSNLAIPFFSYDFVPMTTGENVYQVSRSANNTLPAGNTFTSLIEAGGFNDPSSNSLTFSASLPGNTNINTSPIFWKYRPVLSWTSTNTPASFGPWSPVNITKAFVPPPAVSIYEPKDFSWVSMSNDVEYTIYFKHAPLPTFIPDLGWQYMNTTATPHGELNYKYPSETDQWKVSPSQAQCINTVTSSTPYSGATCKLVLEAYIGLSYRESSTPGYVTIWAKERGPQISPGLYTYTYRQVIHSTKTGITYGARTPILSRTAVWNNVPGASAYQVDLSTDPDFKAMPADPSMTTGSLPTVVTGTSTSTGFTAGPSSIPVNLSTGSVDPYPIATNQYIRQVVPSRTISATAYAATELGNEINNFRVNLKLSDMVNLYGFASPTEAQAFIDHYYDSQIEEAYIATEIAHPLLSNMMGLGEHTISGNKIIFPSGTVSMFQDISTGGADIIIAPSGTGVSLTLTGTTGVFGIKINGIPVKIRAVPTLTSKSYIDFNYLQQSQTYYWRVRVYDPSACAGSVGPVFMICHPFGPWSSVQKFQTGPQYIPVTDAMFANSPSVLSAGPGTDPSIAGGIVDKTFSWSPSSGASTYNLEVSEKSDFSTNITRQSGITGTTATVSGLTSGKTYYYRLQALNTFGASAWSQGYSFIAGK